ncbi:asparagine synthase (glutamine-hydrolyzing) [Bradyrhizobium erythrophlei]|jgi:asparagine synthase (glutamine-hydrolysing)|uniref:asparagine synthase (glutamine-hydrolyzing) n=1 Tax=Bradyrhizobium erythrophlei TaxID=1437360 RepID=A0A1M5JSI3_9BRAD|nr:asparagine synthase (glutamine-hydrolyzing) [Bradyrhizobium erythrophlei]SHG42943.1 asparagine synthase (glutamine-hydrolysing) [Bradyrhizobium erythrophlei]
MCGIAGILSSQRYLGATDPRAIVRMTDAMRHRGPNGEGFWSDREAGITLGHRRLAIIDLTDAGHQPMHSSTGRFVITFNGEIYNFRTLRQQLVDLGYRFRGGSDTEVLLCAIECWGLESALKRSNGMFAMALWDRNTRILHLARDRMGKKPLYVAKIPSGVVFASELKAIHACSAADSDLSLPAVAALLSRGRVPDEHCIWSNVFKLPPAGLLSLRPEDLSDQVDLDKIHCNIRTWWSLSGLAQRSRMDPLPDPDADLIVKLDEVLRAAVRERMVADVPVGAFLSGGLDSSTVVALMQAQSSQPVRTFTVAFDEQAYDESSYAASVARHFGTDHTEVRLTSADALDVIPSLPAIWDEPFADESQIPTLLISREAQKHVTVALSGDGGDECFAGYTRHVVMARVAHLLGSNRSLRRTAAKLAARVASGTYARFANVVTLPSLGSPLLQTARVSRFAKILAASDERAIYDEMTRLSELSLALSGEPETGNDGPELDEPLSQFLFRDMAEYLPSDILVKLDRASMSTSLEARCPMLDHRVIEFAWRLPTNTKIRNGQGKWILRQVLARYLPRHQFERPKQGFNVPIGAWLKGPLRAWASDLLSETRLRKQGLLDVSLVKSCWRDHLNGTRDHSRVLWAALMLQAWLDSVAASPTDSLAALPRPLPTQTFNMHQG